MKKNQIEPTGRSAAAREKVVTAIVEQERQMIFRRRVLGDAFEIARSDEAFRRNLIGKLRALGIGKPGRLRMSRASTGFKTPPARRGRKPSPAVIQDISVLYEYVELMRKLPEYRAWRVNDMDGQRDTYQAAVEFAIVYLLKKRGEGRHKARDHLKHYLNRLAEHRKSLPKPRR